MTIIHVSKENPRIDDIMDKVYGIYASRDTLNKWEEDFLDSCLDRAEEGKSITKLMWAKLTEIYERMH